MTRRPAAMLLLAACLGAAGPTVAGALDAARAQEFEDLGFTTPIETGARASALRAFAATGNDATALILDSAGLARVQRIHGAVVITHESSRVDLDYGNGSKGREVSSTRLAFAGVAYPIPVLRGSLVPALSVHRAFSSDRNLAYARDNTVDGRSESFLMEQTGATYAYTLGVGGDLSPAISVGISAFVLNGSVEALRQYDWAPLVAAPTEHTYVTENIASDVGGYGARLAMRLYLHERLQIGLQASAPTMVNLHSVRARDETRQIDNDLGYFIQETTEDDTEYLLPYHLEGAIAVPLRRLLLTAQVGYTNWESAAIDGGSILTQQTEFVMRTTVGYAAGAEWTVGRMPLRLRAGFSYTPTPLKYLLVDRIDNDEIDRVQSESGRTQIAVGAGFLMRSRIVVDAAWVRSTGSRASDSLSDEYEASVLSLQGSYYF